MIGWGILIVVFGVVFFAVRMWLWNSANPEETKTISRAIQSTLVWIPQGLSFSDRMGMTLGNFFLVPLTLGNKLAILWAVIVYGAAGVGMCAVWKDRRCWVLMGMFSVDVAIHVFCGWGLSEAWIFSPHWFWMLPVLIGIGWRKIYARHVEQKLQ
jgi:hypothetical protein